MNVVLVAAVVLSAAFAVLGAIQALPILLFTAFPNSARVSFAETGADGESSPASAALQDWIRRLRELGFFMIGIKTERLPLWSRPVREAALVSRAAEAYASIVLGGNGDPMCLYFYTPLRDGGMVFTRNHAHSPEAEGGRVSVKNIVTEDFRTLLEDHTRRVRRFQDRGWVPAVGSSPEARIEATRAFYASAYGRRPGRALLTQAIAGTAFSLTVLAAALVWLDLAR